ncbi:MAG TPA: YciI family protein [Gemmatimonadales bacterium]|nr:YciI family protein [Gemmatimonadales bacterium]
MTGLPRETQPDPALEARVVATLVAAGLVRRRRMWPVWVAAAAAIVLTVGVTMLRPKHMRAHDQTYVVLLYEDSTYRPAPAGQDAERVAVLARWGDSLVAAGKFERAGRLRGPGPLGGLFIVRATDDADAARIAASCPFTQWGGHIEVKRFDE